MTQSRGQASRQTLGHLLPKRGKGYKGKIHLRKLCKLIAAFSLALLAQIGFRQWTSTAILGSEQ